MIFCRNQVNGKGQLADGTMVFEMGLNVICVVTAHIIIIAGAATFMMTPVCLISAGELAEHDDRGSARRAAKAMRRHGRQYDLRAQKATFE